LFSGYSRQRRSQIEDTIVTGLKRLLCALDCQQIIRYHEIVFAYTFLQLCSVSGGKTSSPSLTMEKYMHWKQFFTPTKSMNSEEAKLLLRANELTDVQIVDVRQPAEYNNDHIAGAILIPLPELSDSYNLLQKDKPLLVY
jgi:hypothetical protein